MHFKFKSLIISIAITLAVGALSGFITRNDMTHYQSLNQPPLSPPGILFPIVWTILYILMGISAWLVYESADPKNLKALLLYGIQLIINFFWPILFFNFSCYFGALLWLILLLILVIVMIWKFMQISKCSGILQIPYLLWLLFACYLNIGIVLLN
ncbi:TspO/MBR family [uncultured Roseburia sp.]|uniref:Tryptophan-rich sensory protein n=1 Tax=Brotonthovivens ammoniilytica TaxID=2981725 RepID=A0ABT2TG74_9FIRM|nr:TspO/MBR family protein [Brotonthovivens ammoniilytica]MCU6761200.1 tryptophan-rich sensory protein [Brotonthovivens ammoniilytica]SCI21727.1 TspO/MBR family [uncultured Roseburia sp.]